MSTQHRPRTARAKNESGSNLATTAPELLSERYPLQLVATMAAQLIGSKSDLQAAAEKALMLLDECREAIRKAQTPVVSTHVPFRKAVREITGKRTFTDAIPIYKEFLVYWLWELDDEGTRPEPGEPSSLLGNSAAHKRMQSQVKRRLDMPSNHVEMLREVFSGWGKKRLSVVRRAAAAKKD